MGFPLNVEGGAEFAEPDKISFDPPSFHSCHPHNESWNVALSSVFTSVSHLKESLCESAHSSSILHLFNILSFNSQGNLFVA